MIINIDNIDFIFIRNLIGILGNDWSICEIEVFYKVFVSSELFKGTITKIKKQVL